MGEVKFEPGDIVICKNEPAIDIKYQISHLWVIVSNSRHQENVVFVRSFNSTSQEATRALFVDAIVHASLIDLCSIRQRLDETIRQAVNEGSVVIKESNKFVP